MRQSATFLINNPTVLGQGQQDSYSSLLITRCRLRKKRGDRQMELGLISNQEFYEMVCRYDSVIEDNIRVDNKIIISGVQYSVTTWEKVQEKINWYIFSLAIQKGYQKNSSPITDNITGAVLPSILSEGSISIQSDILKSIPGYTVTILWVSREGIVYTYTAGTPADLQFGFDSTTGTISFKADNPGNVNGEKLLISYSVML